MDAPALACPPATRQPLTCGRCGQVMNGGLSTHRRACLKVPRPAELAAIFLSGMYPSGEAMALHYGVGTNFIEERLLVGGVPEGLIAEAREWHTHAIRPKALEKCSVCEIYVVPDSMELPEGWTRLTNGRWVGQYVDSQGMAQVGVLCYGCANGM